MLVGRGAGALNRSWGRFFPLSRFPSAFSGAFGGDNYFRDSRTHYSTNVLLQTK
jgi:hypothetical protein